MPEKTIQELEAEILSLGKQIKYLENQLSQFVDGDKNMYFALQSKMNEMSKMLNKTKLTDIDLTSKSDATFERIFKLLEKSESIANAAKVFGSISAKGESETQEKPQNKAYTPESIADEVGELGGAKKQ